MSWCKNTIWFLLFFISVNAIGQGNVVVHSDPRLAILLKKVRPEPAVVAPVHKMETKLLASASIPSKRAEPSVAVIKPTMPEVNNSHAKPADMHTPIIEGKPTTAEKPVVAATAREHLWTPPVLPRARAVSTGKGFRVQIYNGPDRSKAIEVKAEFMRAYPAVRTYLTYVAPRFRVKVGDYRNRGDAATMLKAVNKKYCPSMIVPDVVTINTF